jgi:hypothetical protein
MILEALVSAAISSLMLWFAAMLALSALQAWIFPFCE